MAPLESPEVRLQANVIYTLRHPDIEAVYHGTNLVYALGKVTGPAYTFFTQTYRDYYINFINNGTPGCEL